MQTNKAILRNREIAIFDKKKKKKIRGRPGEFFFPTRWIGKLSFFFTLALGALFLSTREGHVS